MPCTTPLPLSVPVPGVPDSCIATFCAELDSPSAGMRHVITANEGASVGMALGHHMATGEVPLVYMQNSGLGNAVNPLLSAAHPEVYACPNPNPKPKPKPKPNPKPKPKPKPNPNPHLSSATLVLRDVCGRFAVLRRVVLRR